MFFVKYCKIIEIDVDVNITFKQGYFMNCRLIRQYELGIYGKTSQSNIPVLELGCNHSIF